MEDIERIKEIRDKFESGEITQDEIDIETQKKIALLYREEIEEIREGIMSVRKETEMYSEIINKLDEASKKISSANE